MRNNLPVTGVEHPMREDQSLISKTDTSGNITYVNQAFIEMSGFAEEELLGAPHITLVKTMGCWRGHQFDQPCRS